MDEKLTKNKKRKGDNQLVFFFFCHPTRNRIRYSTEAALINRLGMNTRLFTKGWFGVPLFDKLQSDFPHFF